MEVQKLLAEYNYSGAISLLLNCKDSAEEFMQYNCVQSLNKKLQETLLLTEFQLDTVLNEVCHVFVDESNSILIFVFFVDDFKFWYAQIFETSGSL